MRPYLLSHLLDASAARHPDRPAVAFGGEVLSYAELDAQSRRLAGFLVERGVRPGDRVGLLLGKGLGSVVSLFGVLRAGGVYVPLDRAAPPARLGHIVADCGIRHLLASPSAGATEALPGDVELDTVVVVEGDASAAPRCGSARAVSGWDEALALGGQTSPPPLAAVESDLAYLLYTSGSTGQPKGVMISHRNALTFVEWCLEEFPVHPEDRLANHAPLHFDLSVFDVYAAIATGACVLPVPDEARMFPVRLAEWLEREAISIWYSVPSALALLAVHGGLDRRDLRRLRLVLFAGEVFPIEQLKRLVQALPGPDYYNLYGPTETNVCTYHRVDKLALESRTEPLPIGSVCATMAAFAVDGDNRLAAPGEEGELLVRGPGVALGYWGRPERTAASFVQNPLQSAHRDVVYRTGDLVVLEPSGEYRYLGRRDHQVKVRGYRVELGDVESALYRHPGVKEAAAVAVPDPLAGHRLEAIVVPAAGSGLTVGELRAHCARLLPPYMVPDAVELAEALPRTSNGKVDRQVLAASGR